jgi:hypothetical protein
MGRRTLLVGLGLFSLGLMLTAGCGPSGPKREATLLVKGKLTNAGKPLPESPTFPGKQQGRVMLQFVREGGAGQESFTGTAFTEADGSFEARLAKGKYRIGLQQTYAPRESEDLLGKLNSRSSPIFEEVTKEGQVLDIDISKVDLSKIPSTQRDRGR